MNRQLIFSRIKFLFSSNSSDENKTKDIKCSKENTLWVIYYINNIYIYYNIYILYK